MFGAKRDGVTGEWRKVLSGNKIIMGLVFYVEEKGAEKGVKCLSIES
jgi:hypothetical protein